MSTLAISRCPVVIRHNFPDEMMNYIDEKMDEGQYKKRFRYDRPDKKKSKQTKSILNMNSQEIFQKIVTGKKEPKEERFRIKPKQKINTTALHSALLKVKKQKEELDICLAIADKAKQCANENDICMLANEGAVKFIMSQNLDIDETALLKTKKGHVFHPKPSKSQSVRQVMLEEPENLLSVEGRSYNMAVSTSLCKHRPTSAFSTMRPVSSTKNYSEKGISEHLLQQYADFRNQLFEKLVDNNEIPTDEIQVNVGYPSYLTPSLGLKGGKVPPGFLPKGLKRIHSAATTQNVEFRPFINPGEILFNESHPKRPQTAMISKIQSTSRLNDHLKVIEEVRHQEDLIEAITGSIIQRIIINIECLRKEENLKCLSKNQNLIILNMNKKPFMYVTNPETYTIYKYQLLNGNYVKVGPHIPQEFETLTIHQQLQYRSWKALKFLMWSFINKNHINDPVDQRIIQCRIMDLNSNILLAIISTLGLRHFLLRLQSPFMDYYFEDRLITFPSLKKYQKFLYRFVAYTYFGFALYYGVKSVVNQEHLFDLSLEYE